MARPTERSAVLSSHFREDLAWWIENDRKTALRILDLIEAVMIDPFAGIGKPEPLRFELSGCWSRRITREHRLVYQARDDRIEFIQARYHYE